MGDQTATHRDIKGHLLFEIATEVANRGACSPPRLQLRH